jgi:hypothetical protein
MDALMATIPVIIPNTSDRLPALVSMKPILDQISSGLGFGEGTIITNEEQMSNPIVLMMMPKLWTDCQFVIPLMAIFGIISTSINSSMKLLAITMSAV